MSMQTLLSKVLLQFFSNLVHYGLFTSRAIPLQLVELGKTIRSAEFPQLDTQDLNASYIADHTLQPFFGCI